MLRLICLCICLYLISTSLIAQTTTSLSDSSAENASYQAIQLSGNLGSSHTFVAEELGLLSKRSLEARIDFLPGVVFRDGIIATAQTPDPALEARG